MKSWKRKRRIILLLMCVPIAIVLAGGKMHFFPRTENLAWLFLIITQINIWVIYFWESRMILDFIYKEFECSFVMFSAKLRGNWKEKYSLAISYSIAAWLDGQFDEAYQAVSGFTDSEVKEHGKFIFEPLIFGWKYFQENDCGKLENILEQTIHYRSQKKSFIWKCRVPKRLRIEAKERQLAADIVQSWISILKNDMAFPFHEEYHRDLLSFQLQSAYWRGYWYWKMGIQEKAAEQFQFVWQNGGDSPIANRGKDFLLSMNRPLGKKTELQRNAYKKFLIKSALTAVLTSVLFIVIATSG